ncbi:docking protein 2 [Oenanthe melanoleuca]|uniref:docking protein 2 n=1 Tax=Oenanthe melanoleuca TaxID=2939378 RepID=UPI0024C0F73B|nr:docking protein 2 [Oenanthe melanoleuca]
MEEAVVKQGEIYLQLQQTFGKKWKRCWAVLYRDTARSSARLELREGAERPRRTEPGRRLVRLRDCVRVAAAGEGPCPRDTVPFLLETAERRLLLAAESSQAEEWVQRLCELAFPRSQEEPAGAKEGSLGTEGEFSMEENSLYSSRDRGGPDQSFEVTVRVTPPSQRCRLRGRCILRAAEDALELRQPQSLELLCQWPYRFLRRFGRDKVTFSFEAGRRCASGEGNFEFDTRQGDEIFAAIEAAIERQRGRGGPTDGAPRPPHHARTPSGAHDEPGGPAGEGVLPGAEGKGAKGKAGAPPGAAEPPRGADFPYAEPLDSLRRGNAPGGEGWRAECEYAVPFDTIAKSFLSRQLGRPQEQPPSAGRDAGPRPTAPKPEHIYDEPEGLSALSVYDEPEEVKGEAWRLQAAPEEPPGLACPYNAQRDDYAVPKRRGPRPQPFLLHGREWLGDSDYDNVALKVARSRNLQ